jgi:hypothetical protein
MTVFEVPEKAWARRDCTLIDFKIQFGVGSGCTFLLLAKSVLVFKYNVTHFDV